MKILYEHDIISGPLCKSLEGSCDLKKQIPEMLKLKGIARTPNPFHLDWKDRMGRTEDRTISTWERR